MNTNTESIAIARTGQELGSWSAEDIRKMLAAGVLVPTDSFWREGMVEWSTLDRLHPPMLPPPLHQPPPLPSPELPPPLPAPLPAFLQGQGSPAFPTPAENEQTWTPGPMASGYPVVLGQAGSADTCSFGQPRIAPPQPSARAGTRRGSLRLWLSAIFFAVLLLSFIARLASSYPKKPAPPEVLAAIKAFVEADGRQDAPDSVFSMPGGIRTADPTPQDTVTVSGIKFSSSPIPKQEIAGIPAGTPVDEYQVKITRTKSSGSRQFTTRAFFVYQDGAGTWHFAEDSGFHGAVYDD